ncbi:MAG TPA: hypothetical protein VFE27_00320 [Acidobacteriaceae bacterium]|jgi:hypothetical protein|nr:hypothetical protein [Acidobacteriaceae bacterium]
MIALKVIGTLVGIFVLIHLLAIVAAAFNILWFPQMVGWGDLILLVVFVLCLPLIGFLMFWGFIVGIIGAGVSLGNAASRNSEEMERRLK